MNQEIKMQGFWAGLVAMVCGWCAHAQVVSEGHIDYAFGALRIVETPRQMQIYKGRELLEVSAIRPGGVLVPDVHGDERGILWVGAKGYDIASGKARHAETMAARCLKRPGAKRLQMGDGVGVLAADHGWRRVTVTPREGGDGHIDFYEAHLVGLEDCRTLARIRLKGNDADAFFELRASASGWWLLGAQNNTFLVSRSGMSWHRLPLPSGDVQNLISAYWLSSGELWLLVNQLQAGVLRLTLYRTANLGESWEKVPALPGRLPAYWFEAVRWLSADVGSSSLESLSSGKQADGDPIAMECAKAREGMPPPRHPHPDQAYWPHGHSMI